MNRVEIKRRAKEFAFNNKWKIWKPVLIVALITGTIYFVFGFICGLLGLPEDNIVILLVDFILTMALLPLEVGLVSYVLKVCRGTECNVKEELLSKYKFSKSIIGNVITASALIFAMTLLLIVPGIIYAIKLAMLMYILADATPKELESSNPLKTSTAMMNGHKSDYVIFLLSFLGWNLLSILTFGILYIWVMPYQMVAQCYFYDELKKISN